MSETAPPTSIAQSAQGHTTADQGGNPQQLHADVGAAFSQNYEPLEHAYTLYCSRHHTLFTQDETKQAFSKIATQVKQYSEALIERWSKEIDTYLVYAGLFSAILTAFNVESYQLLQASPPDPSHAILQRISLQLASLSYTPPFINSSYPAISSSDASTPPVSNWAVWLNIFWFSSLILSLSSASVGILVKQWLNEFQSGLSGDSEHVAKLRQYRLNNLEHCRVGSVVNAIPVLLQGALALFCAGLLILLWHLHRAVAAVTSLLVLAIAVFIIGTTITPLVTARCAYLSPQSLVLYTIWPSILRGPYKLTIAVKAHQQSVRAA
ncbi:hypothetical protein ONZ51_g1757 [Trametes cubensis]|uniref:DUF6535 domain-containing protein n=1 Tax=Trametes cubensis TaxID=1111947 RepID=A0AAD7U0W7_9APHY|nr:hypothetical protein ONZ51_g1757 [Trametes cubensis]